MRLIKKQFFSLIELLVAISIITILAGMVIGGLTAVGSRSSQADTSATIFKFQDAMEKYKENHGEYPFTTSKELLFGTASDELHPDEVELLLTLVGDLGASDRDEDGNADGILDGWLVPMMIIFPDDYNTTFSMSTTENGDCSPLTYRITGSTTDIYYNKDSFQIISAGEDETFDTDDDVTNFTKVK